MVLTLREGEASWWGWFCKYWETLQIGFTYYYEKYLLLPLCRSLLCRSLLGRAVRLKGTGNQHEPSGFRQEGACLFSVLQPCSLPILPHIGIAEHSQLTAAITSNFGGQLHYPPLAHLPKGIQLVMVETGFETQIVCLKIWSSLQYTKLSLKATLLCQTRTDTASVQWGHNTHTTCNAMTDLKQ